MKHKHHIIPKHVGGTDDPSNIIEVSVEEHAELHFALYLEHGRPEDYSAAHLLAGIGGEGWRALMERAHTPEANEKRRQAQLGKKRGKYNIKVVNKGWGKGTGRKPKSVKFGDKTYTTMKECAKDLGIHLITAYRWRSEGKIQ